MSADLQDYALDISEDLFRLTTESLRLHSNETHRYETLAGLVDAHACEICRLDEHDQATLSEHLAVVPGDGRIRIDLRIQAASADYIGSVQETFSEKMGATLSFNDALSLVLFDYVVGQKADEVLERLGLDACLEAGELLNNSGSPRGNI